MEFKTSELELKNDINLLCATVNNFPEGIGDTFKKLEEEFIETAAEGYYGISWMAADGSIVYKASAVKPEKYESGEYEDYLLKKGIY